MDNQSIQVITEENPSETTNIYFWYSVAFTNIGLAINIEIESEVIITEPKPDAGFSV